MAEQISTEGRQNLGNADATFLKELIKSRFIVTERNQEEGTAPSMHPLLILGKAGVGKTSIVEQAAKELGIGLKVISLANLEATDLTGLPKITQRQFQFKEAEDKLAPESSERLSVVYIRPDLLPNTFDANHVIETHMKQNKLTDQSEIVLADIDQEAREKAAGILFFDELPSASTECRIAAAKLVDGSRGMNGYKLPDWWLVVAAGNGPEDAGAYINIEGMFFNRCQSYRFEPDLETWLKNYAIPKKVMPEIQAFLRRYPEYLWDAQVENMYTHQFPSPRTWANASDELRDFIFYKGKNYKLTDADLYNNVVGWIGDVAALKFVAYYKNKDAIVPVEDIEAGKMNVATFDERPDAAYLQASVVASRLVRLSEMYVKKRDQETIKKIFNLLKWSGLFADKNIDAGTTLFQDALNGGDTCLANIFFEYIGEIQKHIPEMYNFYISHTQLFQFLRKK